MATRYKILYKVPSGEPIHEIVRGVMPPALELVTLESGQRDELLSKLKAVEFIMAIRLDAEMIAAAPKLRLIQLAGVGFDGIDLDAATRAGIPVAQTVEGTIVGVAEHTLLLILALYKRLLEVDASVRRGDWLFWQLRPHSYTLHGKTVGILGLGRIGREVASRCRAFGAGVVYFDMVRADRDLEKKLGARFLPKDELLGAADIITLHLPLSEQTRSFFGESELRRMRPSALFINTARGGLVDEVALVRALQEGWIAGAGLDVFGAEPPGRDHPLLKLNNTILTPHIATGTRDSIVEKTRAACENFLRVIRGKRPLNLINPQVYQKRNRRPATVKRIVRSANALTPGPRKP